MARLQAPIGRALRDNGPDEAALQRVWAGVLRRGAGEPRRRMILLAPVLALSCAALLLWLWSGHDGGPLRLASGAAWPALTTAAAPTTLQLGDGSQVEVRAGAALELVENSGQALRLRLLRGAVHFAVRPGGPRRWRVDGGSLEIEVIGTRFLLTQEAQRTAVSVEEGVVLVRGARLAGQQHRLAAGEELVVDLSSPAVGSTETRAAPPAATPPVGVTPAKVEGWRELARRQRFAQAFAALQADPASDGNPEDLLLRADVARRAGHPQQALRPLELLISRYPQDRRAALAAFTLGRLLDDDQARPREAAARFAQALRLGLPQALQENALLRQVEAWDRAGDAEAARRTAQEYLARFPTGRHRAHIERWTARQ